MKTIYYISTFPKKKNSGVFYRYHLKNLGEKLKKKKIQIKEVILVFQYSYLLSNIKKIYYLKKKIKYHDIIHCQYGSGCGLIGLLFFKNQRIITLRGSDLYNLYYSTNYLDFFKSLLTKIYLPYFHKIILMSKAMKNICKNISKKKIYIIPDPVEKKIFFKVSRKIAKKKLGLDLNTNYIFYPIVNSNHPEKNFKFANSVKSLFENHKKFNFIYANNKIDHERMFLYYNASFCVMLTSVYEGWPNVIKEALFCDIPVVTTDVSDLKELSKKSKYIHVLDNDSYKFASQIIKYSKMPRPKNLSKIIRSFSSENYSSKIIKIYLDKI
jgi:teichuronic acid biosynthesis glycosyltransferase TuaC